MPELTHWKRLVNPDYLGAYSLQPGEEPVYTIKSVARENITGVGGRVEECAVARFVEDVKPMILNRTNCKTITDIHKTPYIEEWAGKRIQLFAATAKFQGEEVEALRIRPKAPEKVKEVLDQNHKGWARAMEAMSKGETTMERIEKTYTVPPEFKKMLEEAHP